MLPTLGAPSKKSTPEQQMAMMRTYLNQLKDDTEGELYNIRWENLAKPLQDKLNGLDKDIVAQSEQFDYLNANMVSVGYLQANYITASQIASTYVTTTYLESDFVYTGTLVASQITSGTIDTARLNVGAITAGLVVATDLYTEVGQAKKFKTDYLYTGSINASQINAGTISSSLIDTSTLQFNGLKYTNGSWSITLTLQRVQKYGGGEVWCLGSTNVPS